MSLNPDYPFGHGDSWAVSVMRESFNTMNAYLIHRGLPRVNPPLEENVNGYVYATWRAAEVIKEMP